MTSEPAQQPAEKAASTEAVEASISIAEALASRITTVSAADVALSMGLASRDDAPGEFLLPLMEICMDAEVHDGGSDNVRATLTLDNLAFLLEQVCSELNSALVQLEAIAQGALKPDPEQTAQTADWLARSSLELTSAVETLRRLA